MKCFTTVLVVFLLFFGFSSFNKINTSKNLTDYFSFHQNKTTYSKEQIKAFVKEVFVDQADELVFNPKSKRLELITNFLERIHIEQGAKFTKKEIPLLSSLKLQNKYNPNLTRDLIFNPKTFNPLKYNFTMTSKTKLMVRVDATDFVIIIEPEE